MITAEIDRSAKKIMALVFEQRPAACESRGVLQASGVGLALAERHRVSASRLTGALNLLGSITNENSVKTIAWMSASAGSTHSQRVVSL
jgi:hypothetical protein